MIPVIWICRDSCAIDTNQFPAERGSDVCRKVKKFSGGKPLRGALRGPFDPLVQSSRICARSNSPSLLSPLFCPLLFSPSFLFFFFIYNLGVHDNGDNAHANQHFSPFSSPPSHVYITITNERARRLAIFTMVRKIRKLFSIFQPYFQTNFTRFSFTWRARRKTSVWWRQAMLNFFSVSLSPSSAYFLFEQLYFCVTYVYVCYASRM